MYILTFHDLTTTYMTTFDFNSIPDLEEPATAPPGPTPLSAYPQIHPTLQGPHYCVKNTPTHTFKSLHNTLGHPSGPGCSPHCVSTLSRQTQGRGPPGSGSGPWAIPMGNSGDPGTNSGLEEQRCQTVPGGPITPLAPFTPCARGRRQAEQVPL